MDKLIVIVGGVSLIVFIYWFFFGKKDKVVEAHDSINITVSGGYSPDSIKLKKGTKTVFKITRTDNNSCLEEIVFPDFRIKKYLPLHKTVSIELTPEKEGVFEFVCGMNMYHGKIIVE